MTDINLFDKAGTSSTVYIGTAPSGSATSAPVWTIQKVTYAGDGSANGILNASSAPNGFAPNTLVWDNRAQYTYS